MASTPPSPEMLQALTGDPLLPENMRQALRAEAARVFHLPFDTLVTVALNAAIMSSAWFFLPTTVVNELFSLHGSLAFAFVLSSWMYSDVPATNILGPDAIRVLAAIDQRDPGRARLASEPCSSGRVSCTSRPRSTGSMRKLLRPA